MFATSIFPILSGSGESSVKVKLGDEGCFIIKFPPKVPPLAADTKSVGSTWSPVKVTPLAVTVPAKVALPLVAI